MSRIIKLTTPCTDRDVEQLEIGDTVLLNGVLYTARDAAHKRLVDLLHAGKDLPIEVQGQVIFYVGPSPARPGRVIGAAGPTTAYRMDPYAPELIARGLKAMVGKGKRGPEVIEAMMKYKAVYLGATGGAGALIAKSIKAAEIVAYEDLGPEAIRRLIVEDMPTIVINDCRGHDLYEEGVRQYAR
jgi:fumarate hydratase subunit beta